MRVKKELEINHKFLEDNVNDLIKNGLEIISDNFHIMNQKDKKLKELLLESFLLRSCAYWENFLEKEIILLVQLNSDSFKKYYDLHKNVFINNNIIRAILIGDKYRDWHDIQLLKNYFQRIIDPSDNPFEELSNERLEILQFTYTLRNYLSHYSTYSKKKLFSIYNKKYKYKRFIEPGSFLLNDYGKNFEALLLNFVLISASIRGKLGVKNGKSNKSIK